MRLYTIGFTQKSAERFFDLLESAGVRRLIDTRLNNKSQLAAFSKGEDLKYFLRRILGVEYEHRLDMAPTQDMLDRYKKLAGEWAAYETEFNALIQSRDLASHVERADLANACLLCSEHEPTHCHRRLVAEYLGRRWPDIEIVHLM